MIKLEDFIVSSSVTIKSVLEIIDRNSKQIALVVEGKKLIGTVSDGDIRRGLLKGLTLEDTIESIYCKTPTVAKITDSKETIVRLATLKKIHQIPIVDKDNNLISIDILNELAEKKKKKNRVILMVGGLGTRLRPLTQDTPKPMLKVGDKPILQTIVEKFADYGYTNIIMCLNYKSDIIKNYFQDGKEFGVTIEYIEEKSKMGTAGALSLLKDPPKEPFFVMNGDILTNINFEHLHNYHMSHDASGTMCVREYDFQVPYGVVNIKGNAIKSIKEKPIQSFFVSAGIYMLSPDALDFLPKNEYFDMPTLFENMIADNKNIISFPLREYWLDIGRMEEFKKANEDYKEFF